VTELSSQRVAAIRRQKILQLPWVKYLEKGQPCQGIKWGKVALNDLYDMGRGGKRPARDPQLKDPKFHCKNIAHWKFTASRKGGKYDHRAKSGVYCMSHLYAQGIYGSSIEEHRAREYLRAFKEIKGA
jgi:hypothetical protein